MMVTILRRMPSKAKPSNLLSRVRKIAMALPDTEESTRLGGSPHFYVRGKIFTGCGDEGGVWSFGAKVGLELQSLLVVRDGIHIAKYVGRYGWISVDEHALQNEDELRQLIELSYDLISAKAPGGKLAAAPKQAAPKHTATMAAKKAAKK
ncbi:MAG: putative DNA-binding protein (MmcQ/YjbR family) [Planctomycetota bacterium]|jgi:predicted DNA-binding protein (MmcQ/YjbR family)